MGDNANLDAPVPQHVLDAACSDGREWAEGRTLREVWRECPRPDWLLWLAGRLDTGTVEALETECPRLDRCAKECPDYALEYAAGLLTPERLDRCVVEWPDYALEYAAGLLTPERLDCELARRGMHRPGAMDIDVSLEAPDTWAEPFLMQRQIIEYHRRVIADRKRRLIEKED